MINATPGEGFGANTARGFGRDLIVLSMTSGGKGVDLPGLKHLSEVKDVPVTRASQKPIQDLDLTLRPRQRGAGADPPDRRRLAAQLGRRDVGRSLSGDQPRRFGGDPLGLRTDGAGHRAFDLQLDHGLIALAERRGLLQLRPLEARPIADPVDLRADLGRLSTPANTAVDLIGLLARHPVFAGLDREALTRVVKESTEAHLDDQEVLFYVSGERADRIFVLLSGRSRSNIRWPARPAAR